MHAAMPAVLAQHLCNGDCWDLTYWEGLSSHKTALGQNSPVAGRICLCTEYC